MTSAGSHAGADYRVGFGGSPSPTRSLPARKALIWPLLVLMLLVNLAASLYQLPLNRVIERRLCREYYALHDPSVIGRDGNVDETRCKVDAVQQDLAWTQGVMETGWVVGDFIMTIPLAFLAEEYGRRAIFLLNLVPRVSMLAWAVAVGYFEQALPTKAILISPFLSFLGGDCVFNFLTYSLAAGLTDDHASRASYFGYMSSISYVVALLGPALASATMSQLLWLPFLIGISLLLLAIPVISSLPDPRSLSSSTTQASRGPSSPLLKATRPSPPLLASIRSRVRIIHTFTSSQPGNFRLLLSSFVLTSLASADTKLLPQYISKRYGWRFASAGYLLSGKAVVNFILLAVVVPRLLKRGRQRGGSAGGHDRKYALECLAVSAAGALHIAVARQVQIAIPGMLVYALGSALPVFTLSLLKAVVEGGEAGDGHDMQVFSIVMLVKTTGSLLGAPLMAGLWMKGIAIGGTAMGLPFFASTMCYLVALRAVSKIAL